MAKKKQRKTLWKNNNRKKTGKKIAVRETGVYIGIMGEKLRVALEGRIEGRITALYRIEAFKGGP